MNISRNTISSTRFFTPSLQVLRKAMLLFCLLPLLANASTDTSANDVKAAVDGLYQALSSGDAQRFSSYLLPDGFTEFNPDWNGVRRLKMAVFENIFKAGAKIDLQVAEMQVQLIDDNTAVVTGYRIGAITPPGSQSIPSRLALTMIWLQLNGQWKLKHVHLSEEKSH